MWVFKSKLRNSYLATNPKVMGSTLLQQPSLSRYTSKKRYLHFFLKELNVDLGPEYVMLVRNPYLRVESYFKEKLRQKVRNVFSPGKPYVLKRHQEIFYPFLNIDQNATNEVKVSALLNFSFKDFVSRIPEVVIAEDHLSPQTLNFTRSVLGVKKTMKMNKFIHVENSREMEWLAEHFTLDLSIRINSSATGKTDEIAWDAESIKIIKRIYERDFEILGYDPDYYSVAKDK